MTYAVAITEQAAREMEDSAAWWARERPGYQPGTSLLDFGQAIRQYV